MGHWSMTSLANDGPDRNTAGCLRHSASGMSSDIIAPVPTSRPLLTQMMGTCGGSRSCTPTAAIVRSLPCLTST